MAEAILRKLSGDFFEVESAGLEPGELNPFVVTVLKEWGIDISQKKTRAVADLIKQNKEFDYVITVCDEASALRCPIFPGKAKRIHWGFEDPSMFVGDDAQRLRKTRIIRDKIRRQIEEWLAQYKADSKS